MKIPDVLETANETISAELLLHAEGLRGLSNRARKLARSISDVADHNRLLLHARLLDEVARRIEASGR